MKKTAKKVVDTAKAKREQTTRFKLLEELFNDFNRSRVEVYKMNFVRGIIFGLGSALGGTVVLALVIWLLSVFTDIFPFFNGISDAVDSAVEPVEQ